MSDACAAPAFVNEMWSALQAEADSLSVLSFVGQGALPSVFAVTDLAAASVAVAGLSTSQLISQRHAIPAVQVDRRLASLWFGYSMRPLGWKLPSVWDSVADVYRCTDGWIRLHTNASHHRQAALQVLGLEDNEAAIGSVAIKENVGNAVAGWQKAQLEAAVVNNQGCAAAMNSIDEWAAMAPGNAVSAEPLIHIEQTEPVAKPDWPLRADRPLRGVRVLDLTRVLAGPVATRFLAGLGAQVLRIDPPSWDEAAVLPDVTLGKRCARLDLRTGPDKERLRGLLRQADVIVHGYRPGALDGLGLGAKLRATLKPGLVDVSLDAYGWSGPWCARRGFDSLVQMSSGIAHAGMQRLGKDRPFPLPVQALDHSAGYLMAATVLRGLTQRLITGVGLSARVSLARMAAFLIAGPPGDPNARIAPETDDDFAPELEQTSWGSARRFKPPVMVAGAPLGWQYPAGRLGTSTASW